MNFAIRNIARVTFPSLALVAVAACGGGGSTPPAPLPPASHSPPPAFAKGGSVSGLVGQGLTLEIVRNSPTGSSIDQVLEISGNGHFVFPAPVQSASHVNYHIAVQLQPQLPTQRCVVRNAGIGGWATNAPDVGIVCGEFAYVTHTADNTISALSIDATTGAVASVGPTATAGLSPSAIVSASDNDYLYVSHLDSNDVSAFAIDAAGGILTIVPGSPFAAGTNPRAMALRGGNLYVANSGSDTVSAYGVAPGNGVLVPWSPAAYITGAGPSTIAVDPSDAFLYTANASGDVSAFLIDASAEALSPIAGSPFASGGSSISSTVFGAGGTFLYAAHASGGTANIIGFSIDPVSGALTSLAGFPYPSPSCTFIVADQTGSYLYATAGTNVFGFSINKQTGALSPLPGFPIAVGASADSASIDPTNQFLYVRNGNAGTVTGFELNASTGALAPMPGSPFAVGRSADFIATF